MSADDQDFVIAYKGFDKDLKCRGYQFAVGETFTHEGAVEACKSGFHSCEYPLDVLNYYEAADSRFAIVKASGQLSRHEDDTKVASAVIRIEAEISLHSLVAKAVDWVIGKIDKSISQTIVPGYSSAATNTGHRSAAEVSGGASVAASIGMFGKARASEGSAIVLCYRDEDDGSLIHIRASKVGENGVKPDTWYSLDENGEFVEAEEAA